jgi:acyl-CoA thioesterase
MRDPDLPIDELMAVGALDAGRAHIDVPDTWQQGRGAFGGLVAGFLIRALEQVAPDRPLRSLTAELCGPVQPGDAELVVEILRAGNAVTTAAVRLVQHGEVQAHGVGVLGKQRVAGTRSWLAPPAIRPWHELAPLNMAAFAPSFSKHAEFRLTGPLPFAGGSEPRVEGWVRWKQPGVRRDAAYLAACIDAHWPALFSIAVAPRPMATIAFTFQPLGIPADAVYYRGTLVAQDAGYCVELRELWSETGQLLALNQQTFAIIK